MKTLTTSSALLGMLPPPKRKTPGSGLGAGSTGSRSSLSVNKSMAKPPPPPGEADLSSIIGPSATGVADDDEEESGMMLPRGVAKGRKKEEPTMDLFGLCTFAHLALLNLLPQSQVLHCAIPILRFTTSKPRNPLTPSLRTHSRTRNRQLNHAQTARDILSPSRARLRSTRPYPPRPLSGLLSNPQRHMARIRSGILRFVLPFLFCALAARRKVRTGRRRRTCGTSLG